MSTFILALDEGRSGLRVAVKDLVDLAGTPTTAGCLAVARHATPAEADAECMAGIRAAVAASDARIVGKANLHELAGGATGVNPWFGTPVNPIDSRLVPGGSSSGSAVAVATGEADVAVGTDTAGSVRIPSACCGTVGLKTTWGRVPVGGVWPLAPSFDSVGPMARDVAGVVAGMSLLEPGFAPAPAAIGSVGRFRVDADPVVDAAVDAALRQAELETSPVELPGWAPAGDAMLSVLAAEAWEADHALLVEPDGVSDAIRDMLALGGTITPGDLAAARDRVEAWRAELLAAVGRVGVIALPTLVGAPPPLAGGRGGGRLLLATAPISAAGLPALALPVPGPPGFPISLQLVAAPGGEELLVATGARIEAALS